eukprot:tig00020939_g16056.t1
MEPAISQLVSQGAKLDKALNIYLQLIELAWPEPMIAQACKSLHVAFRMRRSQKYAEIEAAKDAKPKAVKTQKPQKPQPKALPATKAPKFKALGPLQRAKAKADLRPRRPRT